jgi:hypothetical protein
MRGGARAPLPAAELEAKFMDNAIFGGWSRASAGRLLERSRDLFTRPRLDVVAELRS